MSDIHLIKCDGCERSVPTTEADGWWKLSEIVASEERYHRIMAAQEENGQSGVLSGDFCSLGCISAWAENAETLRGMEPTDG